MRLIIREKMNAVKKYNTILFCCMLSFPFLSFAQNIVPNPSFENYTSCPDNLTSGSVNQINKAFPWNHPTTGTSDFFHTCNNNINGIAGVPNNTLGSRAARTGQGYAGFYAFTITREYLQTQLCSPMIVGETYSVSFYVGFSQGLTLRNNYATDAVGTLFSTYPVADNNYLRSVTPHIQNPQGKVLKDTLNWELISGSFTADSAYTYITIGYIGPSTGRTSELVNTNSGSIIAGYYYIDDIDVSIQPPPDITADVYSGCPSLCVNFNSPFQNGSRCYWHFGDGTVDSLSCSPAHCYSIPGEYSVKVFMTTTLGCSDSIIEPDLINVLDNNLIADFSFLPSAITILEPLAVFQDQSAGAIVQWEWNFGDGGTSNTQHPQHIYSSPGTYEVELTIYNSDGCFTSITKKIMVLPGDYAFYVPNCFSPNEDGINDTFLPQGNNIADSGYKMQLYNRWGELIFETNDINMDWNGKLQDTDEQSPGGVYVWNAVVVDNNGAIHQHKGHTTLIR